jgi:DNA helicase HerA-like ATPase
VTHRILDLFFGRSLQRETSRYLEEIASAPIRASYDTSSRMLKGLASGNNRTVMLGVTTWKQPVIIPQSELLQSHGLVTGGSGSGKTRFALLIAQALLADLRQNPSAGFGLIDPKGELFYGVLYLLSQLLSELDQTDPAAAAALRQRVVIIDFSDEKIVSPYNLIHRSPSIDPEFFADGRTDQFLDLLPSRDTVSMSGSALLRRTILLLSELNLPITSIPSLLSDENVRARLLRKCAAADFRADFERQFASTQKQTVSALTRRTEALLSSRSVRLALDGATAPDFRALQDDGKIVLINCFGANLSRSVRQLLLQAVVVGDVSQAVFARRRKENSFLWILDEAQNCFLTERLRDQMSDVLTQARSFGSFFLFVTQNISTAVHDTRLLSQLHTNIKWSFSMRGQPADCGFLKAALPEAMALISA